MSGDWERWRPRAVVRGVGVGVGVGGAVVGLRKSDRNVVGVGKRDRNAIELGRSTQEGSLRGKERPSWEVTERQTEANLADGTAARLLAGWWYG